VRSHLAASLGTYNQQNRRYNASVESIQRVGYIVNHPNKSHPDKESWFKISHSVPDYSTHAEKADVVAALQQKKNAEMAAALRGGSRNNTTIRRGKFEIRPYPAHWKKLNR
jgi:hypothetical protein